MNFITGAKGFPKKVFLRALDGMTLKFQGEDYDLESLWQITCEIERDINEISR